MTRIRSHPGTILNEEFLAPLDLSANALAQATGVPANRISEIVRGRRGISADTAIRVGLYLGTSPEFWLNLQAAHDLAKARAGADYSGIAPRAVPA